VCILQWAKRPIQLDNAFVVGGRFAVFPNEQGRPLPTAATNTGATNTGAATSTRNRSHTRLRSDLSLQCDAVSVCFPFFQLDDGEPLISGFRCKDGLVRRSFSEGGSFSEDGTISPCEPRAGA